MATFEPLIGQTNIEDWCEACGLTGQNDGLNYELRTCQAMQLNKGGSHVKKIISCKRAEKKGRRGMLRRGEGHGCKARRRGRAWPGKANGRREGEWTCSASAERAWKRERGGEGEGEAGGRGAQKH